MYAVQRGETFDFDCLKSSILACILRVTCLIMAKSSTTVDELSDAIGAVSLSKNKDSLPPEHIHDKAQLSHAARAQNAYRRVFEGIGSDNPDNNIVELINYNGLAQRNHQNQPLSVPRLKTKREDTTCDFEKFRSHFFDQTKVMIDHTEDFKGRLSYGTFYLTNARDKASVTEREFNDLIDLPQPMSYTPRGYRGRGRNSRSGYQGRSYPVRCAFLPEIPHNIDNFFKFLKSNNYKEDESDSEVEFKLSVQLPSDTRRSNRVVLVFDELFKYKHVHMGDVKWVVLDVIRGDRDKPALRDMRFRIGSRVTTKEIETSQSRYESYPGLIVEGDKIFNYNKDGNISGVKPTYGYEADFLRRKDVKVYRHTGESDEPNEYFQKFRKQAMIKVNYGKEYYSPIGGKFTKINENLDDVAVVLPVPSLEDKKECEEYVRFLWKFGREIGDSLI